MAIIPVKKAQITVLRKDRKAVYAALQAMGKVHVDERRGEELDEPDEAARRLHDRAAEELSRLEETIAFLGKYDKSKRKLLAMPEAMPADELHAAREQRAQVWAVVRSVKEMQDRLSSIKSSALRLEARMAQITPWEALPMKVEDVKDTRTAYVAAGTIPKNQYNDALLAADDLKLAQIELIGEDREAAYVLVTAHRSISEAFKAALTACGFSKTAFEGFEGRPADLMAAMRTEQQEFGSLRARVDEEGAQLAGQLETLKTYYDMQLLRCQRSEQMLKAGLTGSTMNILAWLRAQDVDELEATLQAVSPNVYWEISDPAQDEDAPVLLENNPVTEPFSAVTEMYATPRRKEIDPTPVLSIFYFIFFGMMVSDAGYGILMALLCGIFWIIRKKDTPKLIRLICFGGVSTAFWGAMYGTWFGAELFPPVWFNPMNDPLLMLIVCFIMGFVHIIVGICTKLYINIRNGDWKAGLMDQLSWIVFLLGIPCLLIPGAKTVGVVMLIAGAAAIVLTQGRENKTLVGKFAGGLYSLYGATGYLGDVLSYSRLFALGLATGVIGMVVNSVCTMLNSAGVAGRIAGALVFLGGHIFNLGINVLGAYVHDARLQFVEFFGKFYEGGGRAFVPFGRRTKYHPVAPDHDA
ncbi:MAG: V-type ATP synthase subunit I [Eubacteriales bacterium]|nr:V-type ATP synthase subunit I [Eubacteriales bacterium]